MTKGFSFIDLFAGIGGLRQAMESIDGRCVFTSEWDKFSKLTYERNYRDNRPIAGDITDIDAADVPGHDVLCAGFPCQPFSLAGVSKKNSLGGNCTSGWSPTYNGVNPFSLYTFLTKRIFSLLK